MATSSKSNKASQSKLKASVDAQKLRGIGRKPVRRDFASAVWRIVATIPQGRVTTYGHIAYMLGYPNHARLVGQSLRLLPPNAHNSAISNAQASQAPQGSSSDSWSVPWQRVVNSKGIISPRGSSAAVNRQAALLRQEGVEVNQVRENEMSEGLQGELKIPLVRYGWFP